ncbi:syringomycin biosynthesis enzyme [Actinoplanes sp. OR16]|uniref:TauD/TfdA family dioxygenase n=1 Tax=Actinoplanes sp. OR16 TaxID=946334 RepID=UPI000F717B18|nr:TauD/TfdA family dioxygenase [Actinoplanes sp. OR16]BBH67843.1 syringomycin biosynthesis enzyme [Actinoplanes sp. OR16]
MLVSCRPGSWLSEHRDELREMLTVHGALRLRGLGVASVDDAVRVSRTLIDTPYIEREGFAPRRTHEPGVYSSCEWPPDQPMCMHHEVSYAAEVPSLLVFSCLTAPRTGGATTIADSREMLRRLPPSLVDRFATTGWRLDRHYNPLLGVTLEAAFGTGDPAAVDRYCHDHAIEATWSGPGRLHTSQRRPAVVKHPVTGERCWVNQIAFLNEWTLDPAVRAFLTREFGPGALPFTTAAGDGTPVTPETVGVINDAYDRCLRREPWQPGDVLLVDNLLAAHALDPYEGDREVVVAMGDPVRLSS